MAVWVGVDVSAAGAVVGCDSPAAHANGVGPDSVVTMVDGVKECVRGKCRADPASDGAVPMRAHVLPHGI